MILDTNALSDLVRGDISLQDILRNSDFVYLSPISLGEYRFGIQKSLNPSEFDSVLDGISRYWPCLNITAATAQAYAEIRYELHKSGRPISPNDMWIAAQAREHDLAVVTKDKDFDFVPGLRRQSW